MQKSIIKPAQFILFILCLLPQLALAQYNTWSIDKLDSNLQINADSSINVTETIVADFTKTTYPKHGIIRYIPISYQDKTGHNLNLRFSLDSITDEKGNSYNYEESNSDGKEYMKIGDADIEIQGTMKTYVIKYHILRGLNQFEDHDELFWNSTGLDWDAPILHSTTTVKLPKSIDKSKFISKCFTGTGYSIEQNCDINVVDDQTIQYTTKGELPEGTGITIVTGFPKGLINFPSNATIVSWFFMDNWGYLIPIIVFFALLSYWNKNGRDPKATRGTIMPEYEAPDKLSPAEIGTLIDDRVDQQDISSIIIDLATRGYLAINETKEKQLLWENTSYELEKTTPSPTPVIPLKDFEKYMYDNLFGGKEKVNLNDLKYNFYTHIKTIQNKLYSSLVEQKYFAVNPETTRNFYLGLGGGAFFILVTFLSFIWVLNESVYFGLLLSCVIIFCFGFIMPRKTQKGVDTYIRILGLEEFIKTAEKDRLKFYEKENIFEKILPYAMALGMADKWAKACDGLSKESPSWYRNSSGANSFNTWYFVNSLNSFNNNLSTSLTSAPRSSAAGGSSGFGGGGFSGGGFGGGGGSSW